MKNKMLSIKPKEGKYIMLSLTEEDMKGDFKNIRDCPIARALKRKYNTDDVVCGPFDMRINGKIFRIPDYVSKHAQIETSPRTFRFKLEAY